MDSALRNHRAARAGAVAMLPLIAGLVPFGLTVGTSVSRADLPPLVGWASSIVLYGGSGQLALVGALDGGGSVVVAVVATLIVNVQMLLYGAGMRSVWSDQPPRWRAAAAYLLVGPVFAVTTAHHPSEPDPAARRAHYVGAGVALWVAWLAITGAGALVGHALPDVPVVTVVTPLVLLVMAVRAVSGRPGVVALVVGAGVALLAQAMPYDLGFVAGGVAGVVAAGFVASRTGDGVPDIGVPTTSDGQATTGVVS